MSASLVGLGDVYKRQGLRACELPVPRPRTPTKPAFVRRFGICARNGAEPVSYTHLTLPTICSV
eukprot:780193-Alexandrium_andersonii.AAC.1